MRSAADHVMSTRAGERAARRGKSVPPPLSPPAATLPPSSHPPHLPEEQQTESETIQLCARELCPPLPSIGEVELVFRECCRYRIWRIELRDSTAVVDVHPDDVSSCIERVKQIAGQQVTVDVQLSPSEGIALGRKRQHTRILDSGTAEGAIQKVAKESASISSVEQEKEQKAEEERQRRAYRVGLSYRCGRCGKPKKGHVCDVADGEDSALDTDAKTRKHTPPTDSSLDGKSLSNSSSDMGPGEVKVSGEATTIFKDMEDALDDTQQQGFTPNSAPHQSAESIHSVNHSAESQSAGPQLSCMEVMLADLAFAARPPPVVTPHENETLPLCEPYSEQFQSWRSITTVDCHSCAPNVSRFKFWKCVPCFTHLPEHPYAFHQREPDRVIAAKS
ncbi:MAG: hypothetical protein SGPRY_005836 [Prymnesium sp.]